jgi:hypothetical protein
MQRQTCDDRLAAGRRRAVAIQNSARFVVPFEQVCPHGALCLEVAKAIDFDRRGAADDQARDKLTGERVWLVTVLDLDPEAGKFGASKELKIKVVSPVQPVPPAAQIPGYPPQVGFVGVTISPYPDSSRCKAPENGKAHKCKARQAWSIRAEAMTEPQSAAKPNRAAA